MSFLFNFDAPDPSDNDSLFPKAKGRCIKKINIKY